MSALEVWRICIEYPAYEVSSEGAVRRIGQSRKLLGRLHTHGYLRVSISVGEPRPVDVYIHRLVCRAFNGDPASSDYHAHHLNGDRADNRAVNLRWESPQANRAMRNFCRGERSPHSKLSKRQVLTIKSTPFARGQDAVFARQFGVSRETVRDVRLGKVWSSIHV